MLHPFYPQMFPIESGSSLTRSTRMQGEQKGVCGFMCCKLHLAVCSTEVICWRKASSWGTIPVETHVVAPVALRWGVTAVRRDQACPDHLTGNHRGLPLFTACRLCPYIDLRLEQSQKTWLGRPGTWCQTGANGTEKGGTFFALLWTHWYNDCEEIYVHVGGSECVCVCPCFFFFLLRLSFLFCNISSTLKACCLKSRLFRL